jgi:hypothetical protein
MSPITALSTHRWTAECFEKKSLRLQVCLVLSKERIFERPGLKGKPDSVSALKMHVSFPA